MEILGRDLFEGEILKHLDLKTILKFEQTSKSYYRFFATTYFPQELNKKIPKLKWHYQHLKDYSPDYLQEEDQQVRFYENEQKNELRNPRNYFLTDEDATFILFLFRQFKSKPFNEYHFFQKMIFRHVTHRYSPFTKIWWETLSIEQKKNPQFTQGLKFFQTIEEDLPWISELYHPPNDGVEWTWPEEMDLKHMEAFRNSLDFNIDFEKTPVCDFLQIQCGQGGAHCWRGVVIAFQAEYIHFVEYSLFTWSPADLYNNVKAKLVAEEKIPYQNWKPTLYILLEQFNVQHCSLASSNFYRDLYPKKIRPYQWDAYFTQLKRIREETVYTDPDLLNQKVVDISNKCLSFFKPKELPKTDESDLIHFFDTLNRNENLRTPSPIPRVALERAARRLLKNVTQTYLPHWFLIRDHFSYGWSRRFKVSERYLIEQGPFKKSWFPIIFKFLLLVGYIQFPYLFEKKILDVDQKFEQFKMSLCESCLPNGIVPFFENIFNKIKLANK